MNPERREADSFGPVPVPEDAYYGAQTQRAVANFAVSGLTLPPAFIRALGRVKQCAAQVNRHLGLLDGRLADAIHQAAMEVAEGKFDHQFPVDVFQTGSGTSTNMNANEVIAGRANEILTGIRGGKSPVHPNDHVNLCQSSNDVIPTVLHIAALTEIKNRLLPSLTLLQESLREKAHQFREILKMGRTHLQDAIPIRLGQEFAGYARQVELGRRRLETTTASLSELALGGTAVGTGVNAHPEFAPQMSVLLSAEFGCTLVEAKDHFEAQAAQDAAAETSGALKTVAVSLGKIANDVRWLASGPRCGLGELNLPALQPGSSIMPGKVNPVMPEMVLQVAAQVIGNDAAITVGCQGGAFELNTMLPLIAYNLLQSIELLTSAATLFARTCIDGLTANPERCAASIEQSLALATYLVPLIGYDRAAEIAEEAHRTGRTIREVALHREDLSAEAIEEAFSRIYTDASPKPVR